MSDNSLSNTIKDWSSHVYGLANMYNIELSYDEDTIKRVEQLCEIIHKQIASNPNIKEENVDKVSRMIGAFLGDLIIRNIGGEWILNENKVVTLKYKGFECYPIGKVYKRLKSGNEDNIEFYYKVCKDQISKQKEC